MSVGLAQVQVGWRLSPVRRSPLLLTEDLQALHGPRLGSLYLTMSILVYWEAEEEYRGDFVSTGPWGIGLVKDICILVGSS